MSKKEVISQHATLKKLEKLEFLFFWLRWFYPKAKGIPWYYLLYQFFPQKILRINGRVPWPVHFTSRVLYSKNIRIGNHSAPGNSAGCYIQGRAGIIIGHNLRMGPNVGLISSNHDIDDFDQWVKTEPIRIGNNVWIGMNSVVMPGVTIGSNVVIGANSTVTKSIPDNSIAAGSPCRVLKEKEEYKGLTYSDL